MRRYVASRLLTVGVVLLCASVSGFADQILFERDLPSQNINGPSGSGRSNYAPVVSGTITAPDSTQVPFILGDDFSLSGTGGYQINSLTVYVVANANEPLANELSGLTLYGGLDANGNLAALSSSYTTSQVYYDGLSSYQSTSSPTTFLPVYAVTFSNLNWSVVGGQDYDFALNPTMIGNNLFSLSTSNMANSGGTQDPNALGSDGTYIYFIGNSSPYTISNSNLPSGYQFACTDSVNTGANGPCSNPVPNQDVNVVISGIPLGNNGNTPEPSTFVMMGLGGAILAGLRRRRKS